MKRKITAGLAALMITCSSLYFPVTEKYDYSCGTIINAEETSLRTRDVICSGEDVNRWESEHFQFIWGKNGADSSKITEDFLKKNAENMEACWDIFMNDLSMRAPVESVNAALRDGNQYKVNFYISGTGLKKFTDDWAYMSYDSQGFAYMFCCVGAMQTEPPSWVLPHEFGHVVTAHQLGWNENKYSYAWYETVGNWYREQFVYSDYYAPYTSGPGTDTDFFETFMKNLCFTAPCGRDYYAAWPLMQYLTENPDNMDGYGADFVKKMLQEGQRDEYPLSMIDRLAPADFKDTIGNFAKRLATLDFARQQSYRARLNELLKMGDWNWQQIYTVPDKAAGKENCYRVPTERAPQQAGINIIPLEIKPGTVSVTLNGLTDVKGADWRACIVIEDKNGNTRYTDLFSSEKTQTAEIRNDDKAAYITVAATPDTDTFVKSGLPFPDSEFSEENFSFDTKTRYPYEITVTGTTPVNRPSPSVQGHTHPNGGGFVANTAKVDSTVYVGPDAKVLGYAAVTGNAVITDHAVVEGNAKVSGNALVCGNAVVAENASVSENAIIADNAGVMGQAKVSGNARVFESAFVYGKYSVKDNAAVKGVSFCMADGSCIGQGMTDGDYYDDGSKSVTKGTAYGWVSSEKYVSSRPYTDGGYISYDFDTDSGNIINDRYTTTYGTAVNSPVWEAERTSGKGVITFDGSSQFIDADKSLAYFRDEMIQTAVLWRGGDISQKIFFSGNDEKYMYLTPSGETGKAEFVISDGKTVQKLTAESPLSEGEWSVISVVLEGDKGRLMINGKTAAEGEITINPADTVSENGVFTIGAGNGNGFLNGSMDYFRTGFQSNGEPEYYYNEKEEISQITPGDIDSDGKINIRDLVLLKNILIENSGIYTKSADINSDGKINSADVILMTDILMGK